MHMGRVFQRSVERNPNRTAVVDPDEGVEYDYNDWNERVDQLVEGLEDLGVGPGDRVAVVMQPRVQAGTIYWAVQKIGAVFVPFNIRAAADELTFLVDNTDPDVIIYSEIGREAIDGAHESFDSDINLVYIDEDIPTYASPYESVLAEDAEPHEPASVEPDTTSIILHTSGTTGQPKGVPRTHTNTYTAAKAHAIQSQWVDGERTLGLMPIYHTMGIRSLVTTMILSGTWVAQRSFSPEQTADLIESEELTSLYLVPTVFHDLVKSEAIEGTDTSSVERLGYAGTPMTKSVEAQVRNTFEPSVFVNHYGSTEVYTYSVCSWIDEKSGSAGRAGINTRVRVVDAKRDEAVDPERTVDPGTLGEIIVDATSPEAFDGYLDRPDATEQAFVDDWYFTGDLGYRDEDGDLFVVGRVDDMIISGGENIYPVEVENVLDGHEEIDEVAVVGLEDERWNQVVTAFVTVPGSQPTGLSELAERLDDYCRESSDLADFKRPRKYVFVDEIVKSNVGKVLRRKLGIDDLDVTVYANVNV
ncbi:MULTISPECIES: AMP-binding protein [Halobaculum]|uniref:AMP-binding protein n=2 Tax=Halobaculum TaxID=43927 RepID=A0A8T8WH46_9EURY|nr:MULTISPECIES: AMP-binding protein [Halobaculum]QZP39168.1 AMP-binding protein [Halobaculum magnesiiphilum]QZY04196.1 AMP-binding protein [Halobaculum roseum]